jgi:hypothetical protein
MTVHSLTPDLMVEDLHETDFGWEQFAIEDPNGYVLWFGEKLGGDSSGIGRRHRTYHEHMADETAADPGRADADPPPGHRR